MSRILDTRLQISRALDFAHAHGVIHCDVKPENILVMSTVVISGLLLLNVQICDFGICDGKPQLNLSSRNKKEGKCVSMASLNMSTAPAYPRGTKTYSSPEQALGKVLTPKTDVYSLSKTMLELVQLSRDIEGRQRLIDLASH